MRFVANFEVASEVSVVADGQVLKICDPREAFKALIRNIPRSEFTTPFLLAVHVYFDAEAPMCATCLSSRQAESGCRKYHRIRPCEPCPHPSARP